MHCADLGPELGDILERESRRSKSREIETDMSKADCAMCIEAENDNSIYIIQTPGVFHSVITHDFRDLLQEVTWQSIASKIH